MTALPAPAVSSIARHSKSFSLAARLLPPDLGADAAATYAFCRRADDAIDLVTPAAQPAAVSRLRHELASVYDGEAQPDPVLAAFQDVTRRRRVPFEYPSALLDGMQMDALGTHYPDYESLLVYCYRVAGTVGLMMSHVLGVRHASALRHAAHLGMAMQLTNVCRDVHEDWERGRLYLPDSLLRTHGAESLRCALGGSLPRDARTAISRTVFELLERATGLYASGDRGIPALSFRAAVGVRTARLVYADIGRAIRRQGGDPFAPRAFVSTPRRVGLAFLAALRTVALSVSPFSPADLRGVTVLGFQDVVSL